MSAAERARAAAAPATEEEAAAAAPATDDGIRPSDEQRYRSKEARTRAVLAAQPKVKIRLSKDEARGADQVVKINGVAFTIKRGVSVEVPEGVAELLEQIGLI